MTQKMLIPALYRKAYDNGEPSPRFGLIWGQQRGGGTYGKNPLLKKAGWYNRFGQKIGSGDLSHDDMRRIASGLEGDELFVVLKGEDAIRGGFTHRGDAMEFITKSAMFVIAAGRIYLVDRKPDAKDGTRTDFWGLRVTTLTEKSARSFIFAIN